MTLLDAARLTTARALETGAWDGRLTRVLSVGWNAMASRALCRPLQWPAGIRGITVGGATLGGSGKTPVAIAIARAVATTDARVAFIAHGYRAKVRSARVVRPEDDVRDVGDEAIVAARALAGIATVLVARHRQDAIDFAATRADVMVVDGALQSSPERAWMAVLALDGEAPWGSGMVVPAGDLRADREALLEARRSGGHRGVGVGVGVEFGVGVGVEFGVGVGVGVEFGVGVGLGVIT